MGTWGTAIFSDDIASDIKMQFRDLVGDGKSSKEATDILKQEYEIDAEETVFWLSLAAIQWKCGRLVDEVKNKAIEIINSGADLKMWEDSPSLNARKKVLEKLKEQLSLPQPTAKKIPKHYVHMSTSSIGDVISYQTLSGNYILFRVVGHHQDYGGKYAIYELLDWLGEEIPSEEKINKLGIKANEKKPWKATTYFMGSVRGKDFPPKRAKLVSTGSKPKQEPGGFGGYGWNFLDKFLKEDFSIE